MRGQHSGEVKCGRGKNKRGGQKKLDGKTKVREETKKGDREMREGKRTMSPYHCTP